MFLNKIKRVRPAASFYGLLAATFYLPLGVKNDNCQLAVGIRVFQSKVVSHHRAEQCFQSLVDLDHLHL